MKLGIGLVDLKGDLFHLSRALIENAPADAPIELLDLNGPGAVIPYDLLALHNDETAQELLSTRLATFDDVLGQEGQLSLRMTRMFKYLLSLLLEFEFPFATLDDLMEIENAPGALAAGSKDERVRRYFSGDFATERSATLPALRYRLDHLLAPEGIRLSLSAGHRINYRKTMDAGGLIFINLGGAGPRASQTIQSIVLSDLVNATFRRKQPQVRFPWFIDESQLLFERPSDRYNLHRMLTMSRSFSTFIILLTQSLKAAIHDADFFQTLETNFRWMIMMRSSVSDAGILRPALRATGRVRRGLDHSGRPAFLTPEQEIQSTLQEIANLPSQRGYFWLRGAGMAAVRFKVHQLKKRKDAPSPDDHGQRDIANRAKVRVEQARKKLAEMLRSQPGSRDVGAFLSRIEKMRNKVL
jgi:hypothetical protein